MSKTMWQCKCCSALWTTKAKCLAHIREYINSPKCKYQKIVAGDQKARSISMKEGATPVGLKVRKEKVGTTSANIWWEFYVANRHYGQEVSYMSLDTLKFHDAIDKKKFNRYTEHAGMERLKIEG